MATKKEDTVKEEFTVIGKELKETIKKLLKEGNIRRIKIKHKGKVYLEIPVTVTAVAVLLAPSLAVLGVLATLFSECTVEIEKKK
ncbi:MAG: DUF4342 domain-containing protein [Candidatus Gracilibacteria bacterium]|nr:DUF4342 domain-containing protein [Candidatus Gracilibacteria bacterium]